MLIKNSFYNLSASIIPGLLFFPATHVLANYLDVGLFGIYILSISILGYSGIFEAGIGRGVIRTIAKNKIEENERVIIFTALCTVIVLSLFSSGLLYFLSEKIVTLLGVDHVNIRESSLALQQLSLSPPLTFGLITIKSYFEGKGDFLFLSKCNVISGSVTSILPAVFVTFEPTLKSAITGLQLGQLIGFILFVSVFLAKTKKAKSLVSIEEMKNLFSFGKWVFVSNIISPIMVYFDRFILSNIKGVSSVPFYTAPMDLIFRLAVIPNSLSRVMYYSYSKNEGASEHSPYRTLMIAMVIVLTPVFVFSDSILELWLGREYADKSTLVLRIAIVGFFFNSLAQIPFAKLHALGKSKQTAMLHLLEVGPYIISLYYMTSSFGIVGAAICWTIRVTIDFMLMEYLVSKHEKITNKLTARI